MKVRLIKKNKMSFFSVYASTFDPVMHPDNVLTAGMFFCFDSALQVFTGVCSPEHWRGHLSLQRSDCLWES